MYLGELKTMLTQLALLDFSLVHCTATYLLNVRRMPAHTLARSFNGSSAKRWTEEGRREGGKARMNEGRKEGRKEGRREGANANGVDPSFNSRHGMPPRRVTHSFTLQLTRSPARARSFARVKIRLFCRGRGKQLCDGERGENGRRPGSLDCNASAAFG